MLMVIVGLIALSIHRAGAYLQVVGGAGFLGRASGNTLAIRDDDGQYACRQNLLLSLRQFDGFLSLPPARNPRPASLFGALGSALCCQPLGLALG